MELSVKGKQVDIGDALRTHIEETLPDAIGKYFDNTTDTTVTISKDGGRFSVDIQVHVSRRVLVHGHGVANDAYGALEEASEHVTKRLRRYKRRLRDHKHKLSTAEAVPALQYVLQAEAPVPDNEDEAAEQDEPIIVAEMPTQVETMTVGEATMRMDLANHPAFLFRNSKNGRINMVYMRPDGNIGWVDPESGA
ncbi:MAG: ribosome-associated translation inhibitor RaiA [Alphaproteobacteria bacterium]